MKAYITGGYIRDRLYGLNPHDKDWVVIGSTPEEMIAAGFKKVGADFPVFLNEDGEEYALARTERKSGSGYKGFVTDFAKNVTLEEDLKRRDLTINAMAMDPETGEIIDPFHGQEDLANGILRHVSDAFREDPVRVLRVARLRARYNFSIAMETAELMRAIASGRELHYLTKERVGEELKKAIMEPHPTLFFETLRDVGALNVLFPELLESYPIIRPALKRAGLRKFDYMERMGILTSCLWESSLESFANRVCLHSVTKYFCMNIRRLVNCGYMNEPITPELALKVLNNINAYQGDLLRLYCVTIMLFESDTLNMFIDKIMTAFFASKHISFSALTKEQQATLEGKEIGRAIDDKRLFKITEAYSFS